MLGLRPTGVETLPEALLGAGLARRLQARRSGRVEPPPYDDRRDPETLMLNPKAIAEYMPKLADAIGDRVSRNGLAGFWIHLDADVLDDGVMPAVDYRLPDGLSFDDLEIILQTALDSPRAVGVEITVFNPHLDRDGRIAGSLVESLVRSMSS